MVMSVSAAKPWATPGGMNTPRCLYSPSGVHAEVEHQRGAVGGRALAQVVQHDPGPAVGHVPVVGLVQVVVQADEGAGLPVAPVALDHLPARAGTTPGGRSRRRRRARRRRARLDDDDAVDLPGLGDVGHHVPTRGRHGSGRRASAGWPGPRPERTTSTSRPISESCTWGMSTIRLSSRTPSARPRSRGSRSRRPIEVYGPT